MKFTYLNDVNKINRDDFLSLSKDQKQEIKSNIIKSSVYIVKKAIQRDDIRNTAIRIK